MQHSALSPGDEDWALLGKFFTIDVYLFLFLCYHNNLKYWDRQAIASISKQIDGSFIGFDIS